MTVLRTEIILSGITFYFGELCTPLQRYRHQKRLEQTPERNIVMKIIMRAALALGFVGAMSLGTTAPVKAQGFYLNAPGVHIGVGVPDRPYYGGRRYYDYAPGPTYGGGFNTWNGCPPNYTIQDGVCKPYRGY
jgi:hypothetical protein